MRTRRLFAHQRLTHL
jgi:hypothetical protein